MNFSPRKFVRIRPNFLRTLVLLRKKACANGGGKHESI